MTTQARPTRSAIRLVALFVLLGACSAEKAGGEISYTLIDDMEGTSGNVIAWIPPA